MGLRSDRFRRADTLVIYWRQGRQMISNYLERLETPTTPGVLEVLGRLDRWMSPAALVAEQPTLGEARHTRHLLNVLASRGLVIRESSRRQSDIGAWLNWHPEAALFHFGTKNGRYGVDPSTYDMELAAKARHHPPPPPTKRVSGALTRLPPPRGTSLDGALLGRRTWRRFGRAPIDQSTLATLLQRTFGVQAWGRVKGQGLIAVKTSPSGGARHPIEAYVAALGVRGLPKGSIYHYDAARHQLRRLRGRLTRDDVGKLLAKQRHFGAAAAIIVMAPVFARPLWRYPSARAYRSTLIESGHLCQTLCLVATELNLAPFCTIAFSESGWEAALGLDGIRETPIYIAGVGQRPADGHEPGLFPWVARRIR